MKKILLVVSSGIPEGVIDYAVKRAASEKASLVALYPLEDSNAKEVFDTFTDIGFIGDKPSEALSRTIMKDLRQRGYEELGRVQVKAMEAGVDFDSLMEGGEALSVVTDTINKMDIGTVVMVKKKEGRLLRYFTRSLADELKERTSCEVVVFSV